MNARLAKEGEVSVLRKNIEKVPLAYTIAIFLADYFPSQAAHDHSAQVAKLKAAKEEADAKQIQMQKEIKEEMERLKTQYTFKVCKQDPGEEIDFSN